MKKIKVKICGLMREEDVETCIGYGVDIVGFVVDYPVDVPWNLDVKRAKELIGFFKKCSGKNGSLSRCCIVTGGDSKKLTGLLTGLNPDLIQLHYKEGVNEIRSCALKSGGIIKTIPHGTEELIRQACLDAAPDTSPMWMYACGMIRNINDTAVEDEIIKRSLTEFQKAGADILLVDARTHENAASKSAMLDEKLFDRIRKSTSLPVMAAGGITPDNIREVISRIKPEIIDVMTGVEESYGIKSKSKIEMIMKEVEL